MLLDDAPHDARIYNSGVSLSYKRDGTAEGRWFFDGRGVNKTRSADESPSDIDADSSCSSSPTAGYNSFKVVAAHAGHRGITLLQDDIYDDA